MTTKTKKTKQVDEMAWLRKAKINLGKKLLNMPDSEQIHYLNSTADEMLKSMGYYWGKDNKLHRFDDPSPNKPAPLDDGEN
jgi:hypothetical protein